MGGHEVEGKMERTPREYTKKKADETSYQMEGDKSKEHKPSSKLNCKYSLGMREIVGVNLEEEEEEVVVEEEEEEEGEEGMAFEWKTRERTPEDNTLRFAEENHLSK